MTSTWPVKCWNLMHIYNNSVLHYLYNMAVGLVIYSKPEHSRPSPRSRPRPSINITASHANTSTMLYSSTSFNGGLSYFCHIPCQMPRVWSTRDWSKDWNSADVYTPRHSNAPVMLIDRRAHLQQQPYSIAFPSGAALQPLSGGHRGATALAVGRAELLPQNVTVCI